MIEKLHYRYYNLKQKYKEGNVMRAKTYFFDTLPSTNDKAKKLAGKGAPHGTTVIAYQQTGGRGRNGRSFSSKKGGLYMSMVLRTSLPVNAGVSITIGAAVAVQKAILGCFGIDTDIKWVNDLYYRNKKICGILAEGFDIAPDPEGTTSRFGFIVLGIGVNISDKIIFPGGLKVGDSITDAKLTELFGVPNDSKDYSGSKQYTYLSDTTWTTTNNFKISVVDGVIDEIQLDHRS